MSDIGGALLILVIGVGGVLFTLIIQNTKLWAAIEQIHLTIGGGLENAVHSVATIIRRRSKYERHTR